jgi:ribonuclease P protein component
VESQFSFPRKEKLKKRDEIKEVFRRRKLYPCAGAKLFILSNGLKHNRIAFALTRKYGNAVERNRSRRYSREVYRLLRSELRKGFDLVLLIYPGQDAFSSRMEQLKFLFSKAGLFVSSKKRESS